jgi:hypothetical protein
MVNGQPGATITVRFNGDTIVIYRRMDSDVGAFKVYMDKYASALSGAT